MVRLQILLFLRWGIKMKYIRNDDGFIAFLDDNLHEITDEDLPISDDFYFKLLQAQEVGLELKHDHVSLLYEELDALIMELKLDNEIPRVKTRNSKMRRDITKRNQKTQSS